MTVENLYKSTVRGKGSRIRADFVNIYLSTSLQCISNQTRVKCILSGEIQEVLTK